METSDASVQMQFVRETKQAENLKKTIVLVKANPCCPWLSPLILIKATPTLVE